MARRLRLNLDPGLFGPFDKRVSPTRWDQVAVFGEDVLSLTPGITTYASYSTGKDPVGNNIFLVNVGENFGLSSSRQFEARMKAELPGSRGSLTAAVYDIKRKNILTLVSTDTLSNIGSQTSRGFKISGQFKPADNWTLIASGAYVDAKYGNFVDPNYGLDATGNIPAKVPRWVGNFWTTVRHVGGLPLELGGGVKYVGERTGNSANMFELKPYATGIVYATVEVSPRFR